MTTGKNTEWETLLGEHIVNKGSQTYLVDLVEGQEYTYGDLFCQSISIKKILTNRVLILRISNIINPPNNNKRKLHKTFSDIFFEMAKRGFIYKNKKIYKDFISIKKFNQIVFELIKKNSFGTFNVSLGKKIYINQLITWLNFYNPREINIINPKNSFNNDSFTLNNKKLMQKIKIKNNALELKNECLRISKNFFTKQ
jgi:hypothetical protein